MGGFNLMHTSFLEKYFFIDSKKSSLFCCLYTPTEMNNSTIDFGIIFFNPVFEAAELLHTFYANTARHFAQKHSLLALRFDYFGQGDSQGNFKDATIKTWIENGLDAIQYLKKIGVKSLFLVGFDFGANIATHVAAQLTKEKIRLILVNPILDINKRLKQYLRSNITNQITKYGKVCFTRQDLVKSLSSGGRISVEGYPVSNKFYNGLCSLNFDNINFSSSAVEIDFILLDKRGIYKEFPVIDKYCDLFHKQGVNATLHKEKINNFWIDKAVYQPENEQVWNQLLYSIK